MVRPPAYDPEIVVGPAQAAVDATEFAPRSRTFGSSGGGAPRLREDRCGNFGETVGVDGEFDGGADRPDSDGCFVTDSQLPAGELKQFEQERVLVAGGLG